MELSISRNLSDGRYDVSGRIPTPIGNTLSLRMTIDAAGAITASGKGYNLVIGRDRITGQINPKIFSKAVAACVMAPAVALSRRPRE